MSIGSRQAKKQPVPASAPTDFKFPINSHLLITFPSRILSWDASGINTIFRSSKSGIAAAREAKDGSGLLAIADKQVVVLHDTKRGQEKSWGLEAEQDEVRHLEYTADAKSLFLSTSLTTDIQCYCTERSKLLDPANTHASPPVALAVSSTGQTMISASDHPPAVYLKNLSHNSSPILIEPRISRAAVSVLAFHPERANIFLMAFRDGSIAAYDTTRIGRKSGGKYADQQSVNHGQISSFLKLHRATTETSRLASITGAAFLPGFKTRAVTVGNDGRCRIIDFAGKGEVLRTWHAKAPVTSVSVLSIKDEQSVKTPFSRYRASHTIGGPTSTDNVLAVGRADGAVHIYDSVGLLLDQKSLADDSERIVGLEWVRGPSLRPVADTIIASRASVAPSVPPKSVRRKVPTAQNNADVQLKPMAQGNDLTSIPTRQFTIHPDEAEEDTVRHTPLPGKSQAPPANNGPYLDLFSPVKPADTTNDATTMRRVGSPPRTRPRISSQTFIKSPEAEPTTGSSNIAKPRNIALFPSTDSGTETFSPHISNTSVANTDKEKPPASVQKQRITWKPSDRRRSRKSIGLRSLPTQTNSNAKVLADLRKMSTARTANQAGGVLAAFKTAHCNEHGRKDKDASINLFHRPTDHIDTDLNSLNALQEYDSKHREKRWVEDSEQDDLLEGDIWLTSDSGDEAATDWQRRKRPSPAERPPARQTSRTRVTSKDTMSTAADMPVSDPLPAHNNVDGSTENDEGMQTARSQVSLSESFSPSSKDISHLFPRSSSLSPHKKKRKERQSGPLKRSQRLNTGGRVEIEGRALREMTLNTAHTRHAQTTDPWTKMKASKASLPTARTRVFEDASQGTPTDGMSEAENTEPKPHCAVCGPTQARVVGLECEVARLKGEVLAMKAVLRRNGLAVPKGR